MGEGQSTNLWEAHAHPNLSQELPCLPTPHPHLAGPGPPSLACSLPVTASMPRYLHNPSHSSVLLQCQKQSLTLHLEVPGALYILYFYLPHSTLYNDLISLLTICPPRCPECRSPLCQTPTGPWNVPTQRSSECGCWMVDPPGL